MSNVREGESTAKSPDTLCPPLSARADVPQPSPRHSRLPHPSQKCTLGAGEVGASAKPTICRRLEINDRPKPSGSPSHSAASVGSADGSAQPSLLFFFFLLPPFSPKIRARETPASHAGVCLGETVCVGVVGRGGGTWSGFVSVERSPLLRGVGRWNGVVKAAVSQLITAANFAELENRGGSKGGGVGG